ncbi:MAG: molybdopterin molybdotransferase MoeA [Lachnospiraceae bacterium]|nr:molybdopterin molybdotransferase MoeA [Lachnospiraceae bacterium]
MMISYKEAVDLLVGYAGCVGTGTLDLEECSGRILAEDIIAKESVPHFDRSPYDGYAFRAADTLGASDHTPVTLKVIENIRAGQMAKSPVEKGMAIRLMTGAPLPEGADAICKYEDTDFTDEYVRIKQSYRSGDNVIMAGEDIKTGDLLAGAGSKVDPGLSGVLASLGMLLVKVYKKPVAAIITTGDEVTDPAEPLLPAKIRNSNRYIIGSALKMIGFETVYTGHASDSKEQISGLIKKAEEVSDIIISTGGVSVGDYDLVPDAMTSCGYEILADRVDMKPGMACAYGIKEGKMMLALSGNPASALTNLQCVCYPALKKMAGYAAYEHEITDFIIDHEIKKTGGHTSRFVRGCSRIEDGKLCLKAAAAQGNVVISSAAGADAYGILTGMKGPVMAGSAIPGFLIYR